jgi:DNA-binding transcriptional ArsR family regulator
MHEQTISILKALADPTRLDIIRLLVKKHDCASCGDVSAYSKLSQPAMSHHFNKLVEAGVLLEQKTGKEKFYELNISVLENHGIDPTKL